MSKEDLIPFKEGDDPRRNVTGANKGSQWSKTIIRKYFDQIIKGKDLEDNDVELPAGDLAIIAAIKNALANDTKSLKELLDRLEGTPTQTIKQTTTTETNKPINEWIGDEEKDNETE